jgi:hypothetical protein
MQKKNVLGTDPFKWIKENNKKENTESLKSDIVGQDKQTEKPLNPVGVNNEISVKRKEKQEEKTYEPIDVSETLKRQGNKVHEPGNVTESYNLQEDKTIEPRDISEVNRKAVLGKGAYDYHAKSRETTQKESPATAFVIVYTVLLLILGFIIYRDMTKQIDRLETKLETIEKQLDAGLINYEDTKLDDVW